MYNGSVSTVWHGKLCMKTWYCSKSLWISLWNIFMVFMGQKCVDISNLNAIIDNSILELGDSHTVKVLLHGGKF